MERRVTRWRRPGAGLGLLLLAAGALLALGAPSAPAESLDVVVMVDVSASMFPVFADLKQYLLRDLPEKRLHAGDTYHLLSFADQPELELSTPIQAAADLKPVVDRILLLQPLGGYTDLIAALDFLYEYTRALPGDNGKLLLLLTDGIHDPPPGSPNRLDGAQTVARLLESTEKIRREGWNVHILQLPGGSAAAQPVAGGAPAGAQAGTTAGAQAGAQGTAAGAQAGAADGGSGAGQNVLQALTEQLQAATTVYSEVPKGEIVGKLTGISTLHFPGEPLGRVRRRFSLPMRVSNFSGRPQRYALQAVHAGEQSVLRQPVAVEAPPEQTVDLPVPLRLPAGMASGAQRLALEFRFSEDTPRISPLTGEIDIDLAGPWVPRIPLPYLLWGIGILVLLAALLLLVFLVRRRLQDAAFARFFEGLAARRGGGVRPLLMRVDEQNPNIGARNIHPVLPGAALSVGGDGSAFVIFYVPMPRRIGIIRNEKGRYVFVPKRPEHFVDLQQPLSDCLGQPIRLLSSRGHRVTIRFQEYVSPLEEINRLMRSIRQTGKQPGQEPGGPAKV